MPYRYSIDEARRLITVICAGDLPLEEAEEATSVVLGDPAYKASYGCLVDMRGARFHVSSPDSRRLAEQNATEAPPLPPGQRRGQIALVTGDEISYGVARQYAAFSGMRGIPVEVFRDLAAAASWLGIELHGGATAEAC